MAQDGRRVFVARKVAVVVEVGQRALGQLVEDALVVVAHVADSDAGGGFLVHQLAELGLALDDHVGNVLLPAQLGEPDDELDGVDVVRDQDELGRALLNEAGDVVEAESEVVVGPLGARALAGAALLGGGLRGAGEAGSLLFGGLGLVLVEQVEDGAG